MELEIAALKEAEAEIQYRQLLAKEVQDEQDTARSIIIEDQLNTSSNAYINNIAARVKTFGDISQLKMIGQLKFMLFKIEKEMLRR